MTKKIKKEHPRYLDLMVEKLIFGNDVKTIQGKTAPIYQIEGEQKLLPEYCKDLEAAYDLMMFTPWKWVVTKGPYSFHVRTKIAPEVKGSKEYSIVDSILPRAVARLAIMTKLMPVLSKRKLIP